MKKRLTMALAAGALMAAMVPGVASAAKPPALWFGKVTDACGETAFGVSPHWDADFNPSGVNAALRGSDCGHLTSVRAGALRP